jgi:hypothetical protein
MFIQLDPKSDSTPFDPDESSRSGPGILGRIVHRMRAFFDKHGDKLALFVAISLVAHAGLATLAFLSTLPDNRGKEPARKDYGSFLRALREVGGESILETFKNDPRVVFSRMPKFSGDPSDAEKRAVYRILLESAEARNIAGVAKGDPAGGQIESPGTGDVLSLGSGDKVFLTPSTGSGAAREVSLLPKSHGDRLKRLDFDERFEKDLTEVKGGRAIVKTKSGVLEVPEEIYFRDCPFEGMAASGAAIFRIVRGFPEALGSAPIERRSPKRVTEVPERPRVPQDVFLVYQKGTGPEEAKVLKETEGNDFSEPEIGRILDGLMGMSDAAQFAAFDERYLRKFDPDNPGLARLAREFLYTNLNSVFILVDDFASAFDGLEEIYYKKPVYDAMAAYGGEHPRTKTGAELLFGYASALEFESRTLKRLFEIYPKAGKILAGSVGESGAFRAKSKAFVARRIYDDLESRLKPSGSFGIRDIEDEYAAGQKAVYTLLIGADGEVRDRALFSLGRLEWDRGENGEALKAWRAISPAYDNASYQKIRPVIMREASPEDFMVIEGVFDENASSGNKDLLDRLLKFHKWRNRALRQGR